MGILLEFFGDVWLGGFDFGIFWGFWGILWGFFENFSGILSEFFRDGGGF